MKKIFAAACVASLVFASVAFGADSRYTLTEYSMNDCAACVAARDDVAAIEAVGIDVRCVNTSVDPWAAEEARRFQLKLRPAWRLARPDGSEVGRWYGAGKSALIVATIRAKFPAPDEEKPVEETKEEEAEREKNEATQKEAPKPELAPNALAELDALADEQEAEPVAFDFRERAPVAERFRNSSFLDKSLEEWERRGEADDDEKEEEEEKKEDEEKEAPGGLFKRKGADSEPKEEDGERAKLGDRIADRAASSLLKGLIPALDSFKGEALSKLEKVGDSIGENMKETAVVELTIAKQELFERVSKETTAFKDALFQEVDRLVWRLVKTFALIAAVAFVAFLFLLSRLEVRWK